jgi:capsular polysaccharide export protein
MTFKWRARLETAPLWFYQFLRTLTASKSRQYACTSLSLTKSQSLKTIIGESPIFYSRLLPLKGRTVIGWGRKWSGQRAVTLVNENGGHLQLIEDGFVCSDGCSDGALSLVFDSHGIYYDATSPSGLESFALQNLMTPELVRASNTIFLWRSECVSKYNSTRDTFSAPQTPYILVCDQIFGDASISYGLACAENFTRMLDTAQKEYPNHTIILKIHPDVSTRGKKGHFNLDLLANNKRIKIISNAAHPSKLIEHADAVYTVTSQMGFEALLWGKRVRCFGMPFYAGWGLTEDELPPPARRKPVSLEQLVHAALVKYPRYIDPVTMQRCEPEVTFRHVGLQRRKRQQFPEQITAVGFSRWKRPFIEAFLQGSEVAFVNKLDSHRAKTIPGTVSVWGSSEPPQIHETSTVLHIEDGFLRSSGLGADLVRPLSLVIDDVGIYYDATRPSRLEHILQNQALDTLATERAQALRERLIQLDLTKYNLGKQSWSRPETDQLVLLVVGQVESDASIRLGSPDVKSNLELLRRVRKEHPSAYIAYKPHPDVVAGLRKRGQGENACLSIANEVLTQPVSLSSLVTQVDEVHTMTSLLGFEALIRGAKVICYGLPFYAGWGLTVDRLPCPRRTRKLTLNELVHGALIDYPRYYNFERQCFVEPEQAVGQLAALANTGPQSRSLRRKALRLAVIGWLRVTRSTK